MSRPVRYEGSVTVPGTLAKFDDVLNPRNWWRTVPEIWRDSYLVGPQQTPADTLPLDSRADTPPRDVDAKKQKKWPAPGLFFEDVWVVGFHYRNVLETSRKVTAKSIRFDYKQYECMNTESTFGLDDGGIDVDHGFTECKNVKGGLVEVTLAKTVRFTQPGLLEAETDALAHTLIPLTFDGWLHQLIFSD